VRGIVGHHREYYVGPQRRLRGTRRDTRPRFAQWFGAGWTTIENLHVVPGVDQVLRDRCAHRAKSYKSNFHNAIPNDRPRECGPVQTAN
jgi:hypothetical protein